MIFTGILGPIFLIFDKNLIFPPSLTEIIRVAMPMSLFGDILAASEALRVSVQNFIYGKIDRFKF